MLKIVKRYLENKYIIIPKKSREEFTNKVNGYCSDDCETVNKPEAIKALVEFLNEADCRVAAIVLKIILSKDEDEINGK